MQPRSRSNGPHNPPAPAKKPAAASTTKPAATETNAATASATKPHPIQLLDQRKQKRPQPAKGQPQQPRDEKNIVSSPAGIIPPPPKPIERLTALMTKLEAQPGGSDESRQRKRRWISAAMRQADLTDHETSMLIHILEHGGPENLPYGHSKDDARIATKLTGSWSTPNEPNEDDAAKLITDIVTTTRAGHAVLTEVLAGSKHAPPADHKKRIRQMMWALYERSVAKSYPFIGGMIVLDDDGKVAEFLKSGGKVDTPSVTLDASSMASSPNIGAIVEKSEDFKGASNSAAYYERPSSHFQERRLESLGMDFHGPDERLPLNKRTLHFGTLKGTNSTFVKFEYYGFYTRKDKLQHSLEFVDVVVLDRKETGFRETPSTAQIEALRALAKNYGLNDDAVDDPALGRLSSEKSGLVWAREKIKAELKHPQRAIALKELDRIIKDGHFPERAEYSPGSSWKWRPRQDPRTRQELAADLKKLDNPKLRQGEEVIFHRNELNKLFKSDLRPSLPQFLLEPGSEYKELITTYDTLAAALARREEQSPDDFAALVDTLSNKVANILNKKPTPAGMTKGDHVPTDELLYDIQQQITTIQGYLKSRHAASTATTNAVTTQTRTPSDPPPQDTDATTSTTTTPPSNSGLVELFEIPDND